MPLHLITGGSGFVGARIAHALVAQGEAVRVLDIWRAPDLPTDAEYMHCDVNDANGVERALRGVDYVHHNAALVPLTKANRRFWQVNVIGTETILRAAHRAKVKMFVHMSSSAVFGAPEEMPITADTPLRPIEPYGLSKLEGERRVHAAIKEGLNAVVIRPRTIVGPGRLGIFQILFDWIYEGRTIYLIGRGDNPFQFVHIDDLVDVAILACRSRKSNTYNVGADHFGTLRQDLEALIAHANTGSHVKGLPAGPTIFALRWADKLGLSPLSPWHYLTYHRPFYFDVESAPTELGWQAKYGNQEMLISTYDWFIQNRDSLSMQIGASPHRRPVRQRILRLIKALS